MSNEEVYQQESRRKIAARHLKEEREIEQLHRRQLSRCQNKNERRDLQEKHKIEIEQLQKKFRLDFANFSAAEEAPSIRDSFKQIDEDIVTSPSIRDIIKQVDEIIMGSYCLDDPTMCSLYGFKEILKSPSLRDSIKQIDEDDPTMCSFYGSKEISKSQKRKKKKQQQQDEERRLFEANRTDESYWAEKENDLISKVLEKDGLQIKEMKSDGHCLFRAVEDQLKSPNSSLNFLQLRKMAATYMLDHKDDFEAFFEGYIHDDQNQGAGVSFQDHCRDIRDTAAWGWVSSHSPHYLLCFDRGELEMKALSASLGRSIEVYLSNGSTISYTSKNSAAESIPIRLSFHQYQYATELHMLNSGRTAAHNLLKHSFSSSLIAGKSLLRCPSRAAGFLRSIHTEPVPIELFQQHPTLVTTLSNGLRVASQATFDETVTVGVFVDSGSRYETADNNGVAHFLEHMLFKGTQRRSRYQLEKEIENMGAHLNAYTAREQTVYYAKAFGKDLEQAVDILSDVLIHSKFDPAAIEEERSVILREMEEVEKSPEEVVFDWLHMAVFRDSSLRFTILGPPENIQKINRNDIIDYIQENYTADRLVIAAAGNVDHANLVKLSEKYFGGFRKAVKSAIQIKKEKPYFCGSQISNRNDLRTPFLQIAMAYPSVGWTHPAQPVFMVMQSIIGSYDRMNEGLVPATISGNRSINNVANREDIGCAEYFSAFNTCYKDIGLFGFYIKANAKAALHAIEELMFSVCCLSYCVTEEEVQTAKRNLKNNLFGTLDTTTAICEDIGRQIIVYGRRIPLAEMYKRIDQIDVDEVRRVAWEHLYDAECSYASSGASKYLLPYQNFRYKTRLGRW